MEMEHMTSFALTINNWDDRNFRFKYSDEQDFDVGQRVHVMLGYADQLRSMVTGYITTLTPRFPESGQPTLGVSGLDAMVLLRDRKPTGSDQRKFVNMTDADIAKVIARRNGLRCEATQGGEKHDLVIQKNQDDAQFLMERASRIDYDCFIHTDPVGNASTLHFEVPTDARDGRRARVYRFVWGESLIAFNPVLTIARQVSKVTVRGWNPATKSVIEGSAGPDDLPGAKKNGDSGPQVVASKLGNKQDVVLDALVTSQQEARALALQLLRERAYDFITGSGDVIGLADLRPGDNIDLAGLGTRFTGTYYVKKVEHAFGANGYTTHFEVRRVYDGGVKKK
jgi:phage protein D